MEHMSYRDQIIWGTSLEMAKEDEIALCYKYIKEHIINKNEMFKMCDDAKSTKNFIDVRWLCGEAANSYNYCDKIPSITKEHLAAEIEAMVTDAIDVDGENIIKIFKKRGYIDIYRCNRVFFIEEQ